MATATVRGDDGFVIPDSRVVVESRGSLSDGWVLEGDFTVDQVSVGALPGGSRAALRLSYGRILREGATQFVVAEPRGLIGRYVRVSTRLRDGGAPWVVRWGGYVPLAGWDMGGREPARTGETSPVAVGAEWFLGQGRMSGCVYTAGEGVVRVTTPEGFNLPGPGGGIVGNRSAGVYTSPSGVASFVFSRPGAAVWSAGAAIEYILGWHAAAGGPRIVLTGDRVGLDSFVPVMPLSGRESALDVVMGLIDQRRGLVARLIWYGEETAELRVCSVSRWPVQVGSFVLPANTRLVELDLESVAPQVVERAGMTISEGDAAAVVRVRGGAVRTTLTMDHADGTLAPAWAAESEELYKQAGGTIEGFGGLATEDKAKLADAARQGNPWLRAVYTKWAIPGGFPWMLAEREIVDDAVVAVDGGVAAVALPPWTRPAVSLLPAVSGDGLLDAAAVAAVPERVVALARETCLYRGWDYRTNPPLPIVGAEDRTTLEPPMAWGRGGVAGGNDTFAPRYYDMTRGGLEGMPTGTIAVAEDGRAVWVRTSPLPHVVAANDWEGALPSEVAPVLDWRKLLITVAVDGPERLEIVRRLRPKGTEVVIDVPGAVVWWVAPGTVWGVDDDGRLLRVLDEGGVTTRDDRAWLRAVMALALSWYRQRRLAVTVAVGSIVSVPEVGSMLARVATGAGEVVETWSVVTGFVWDMAKGVTTLETGALDLDIGAIANDFLPGGTVGLPGVVAGGATQARVDAVERAVAKTPVRWADSPGLAGELGKGGSGEGEGGELVVPVGLRFFTGS